MIGGSTLDKNLAQLLPKQLEAKDKALQESYETFKTNVTVKALKILQEVFPRKIEQFNSQQPIEAEPGVVINVDDFPDDECYTVPDVEIQEEDRRNAQGKRIRVSDNLSETPTEDPKYMKLSEYIYTHKVPLNKKVAEKVQAVKQEAAELLELVATVKLWIQLNIPKIEDGNNFGVGIQEEVIQELSRVEDAAFSLRDSISKYFAYRAKLITKVVKYPNVEDYRLSLRELDEKQWFQMKITAMDTRNNYAILFDMVHKNWQKLVKPRSTDGSMMVY